MTSCTNAGIMKASENHGKNYDLMPHVQLPRNNRKLCIHFQAPRSTLVYEKWWNMSACVREPMSQPKHPVWVWKRSVWITYHLHIWNGSKAGDKDVGLDFCDWTYSTSKISSSLIQITATLRKTSRNRELEIYNVCMTYTLLKNVGKIKKWLDCQPHMNCLVLFPE